MNTNEITAAVDSGKTVHVGSEAYSVTRDSLGRLLVVGCEAFGTQNWCIGLTSKAGKLNYAETAFFVAGACAVRVNGKTTNFANEAELIAGYAAMKLRPTDGVRVTVGGVLSRIECYRGKWSITVLA